MISTARSWGTLRLALAACLLCLNLLSPVTQAAATCYCKDNGAVNVDCANAVPCGDATSRVQQCCISGHQCLSGGFCYSGPVILTNQSDFYMGGCTDQTFKDPMCPQQCTDLGNQEVVYNNATDRWACCTVGNKVSCDNPSNETFSAPSPQQILASPYASMSSASSTSASSTSTSFTATFTSSPTSLSTAIQSSTSAPSPTSPPSSSELSTGAKAGIGVGASVGGLAIIGALAFAVLRSRKPQPGNQYTHEKDGQLIRELAEQSRSELDGRAQRSELGGLGQRAELQS